LAFRRALPHSMPLFPRFRLRLAVSPPSRTVNATKTHLAVVASQCALRTPSPLKLSRLAAF
jgi:hypothetical protein